MISYDSCQNPADGGTLHGTGAPYFSSYQFSAATDDLIGTWLEEVPKFIESTSSDVSVSSPHDIATPLPFDTSQPWTSSSFQSPAPGLQDTTVDLERWPDAYVDFSTQDCNLTAELYNPDFVDSHTGPNMAVDNRPIGITKDSPVQLGPNIEQKPVLVEHTMCSEPGIEGGWKVSPTDPISYEGNLPSNGNRDRTEQLKQGATPAQPHGQECDQEMHDGQLSHVYGFVKPETSWWVQLTQPILAKLIL